MDTAGWSILLVFPRITNGSISGTLVSVVDHPVEIVFKVSGRVGHVMGDGML